MARTKYILNYNIPPPSWGKFSCWTTLSGGSGPLISFLIHGMWYENKIWVLNSFILFNVVHILVVTILCRKKGPGRKLSLVSAWQENVFLIINCRNVSSGHKVTRKLNYLLQQLNLTVNVVFSSFTFLFN